MTNAAPIQILVAEDDTFLANAYRIKLTKEGYDVLIAQDGEEALEYLKNKNPSLILLDLIMPVKDGFSVLEDMKKNPVWEKIPVIIASNLGQKEDIDRGLALGAKDYTIKIDLSLEQLIEKIRALL
jgi:DNA-binding response OmpR family regulator